MYLLNELLEFFNRRNVADVSVIPSEKEVIIPPGTAFVVKTVIDWQTPRIYIVDQVSGKSNPSSSSSSSSASSLPSSPSLQPTNNPPTRPFPPETRAEPLSTPQAAPPVAVAHSIPPAAAPPQPQNSISCFYLK